MSELNNCRICGHEAVLQTRHEMKPEHHKQQKQDASGRWVDDTEYEHELHEGNRDDIRVACSHCPNATGWNKRDQPGMPGVGIGFMKNHWNERNLK